MSLFLQITGETPISFPEEEAHGRQKYIFCLCDDLLKAMHHQENRQCQMNDAEIMTTAFIAALFFRGMMKALSLYSNNTVIFLTWSVRVDLVEECIV